MIPVECVCSNNLLLTFLTSVSGYLVGKWITQKCYPYQQVDVENSVNEIVDLVKNKHIDELTEKLDLCLEDVDIDVEEIIDRLDLTLEEAQQWNDALDDTKIKYIQNCIKAYNSNLTEKIATIITDIFPDINKDEIKNIINIENFDIDKIKEAFDSPEVKKFANNFVDSIDMEKVKLCVEQQ